MNAGDAHIMDALDAVAHHFERNRRLLGYLQIESARAYDSNKAVSNHGSRLSRWRPCIQVIADAGNFHCHLSGFVRIDPGAEQLVRARLHPLCKVCERLRLEIELVDLASSYL